VSASRLQCDGQHRNCGFRTGRIHPNDWRRVKRILLHAVSADTWRHAEVSVSSSTTGSTSQAANCLSSHSHNLFAVFRSLETKCLTTVTVTAAVTTLPANRHHTRSAAGQRSTLLPHSLVSDWSILYLTTMYELQKHCRTRRNLQRMIQLTAQRQHYLNAVSRHLTVTSPVPSTLQSDALSPDITCSVPGLTGQQQESFWFETRLGLQFVTSTSSISLVP